jgi:hypothetical protein
MNKVALQIQYDDRDRWREVDVWQRESGLCLFDVEAIGWSRH